MKTLKVKLTFVEPMLGTASGNPEIHHDFIASKAPDAKSMEEEVAAIGVENVAEKGMTVFPVMDDGTPFIWDYQLRGFFKETCGGLKKATGSLSANLKAHKKAVDNLVFIDQRRVVLNLPEGVSKYDLPRLERPLRAETPQGPRVALVSSEMVPAGTWCEFKIICFSDELIDYVREWLDFGYWKGTGQWRSGGWGRFVWEEIDEQTVDTGAKKRGRKPKVA